MLAHIVKHSDAPRTADGLKPALERVERVKGPRGALGGDPECAQGSEGECGVVGDVAALDPDPALDRVRADGIVKAQDADGRVHRHGLDLEVPAEPPDWRASRASNLREVPSPAD